MDKHVKDLHIQFFVEFMIWTWKEQAQPFCLFIVHLVRCFDGIAFTSSVAKECKQVL